MIAIVDTKAVTERATIPGVVEQTASASMPESTIVGASYIQVGLEVSEEAPCQVADLWATRETLQACPPDPPHTPPRLCSLCERLLHYVCIQYTHAPTKLSFATAVVVHYSGMAVNTYICLDALANGMMSLFLVTLCALVLPGLHHSVNIYLLMSVVQSDISHGTRRREALFTALNLNRALEAHRFWLGKAPTWTLHVKDRLGHLTVGVLPAVTINITSLLKGTLAPGFSRNLIIGNTVRLMMDAGFQTRLAHSCCGPPTNMQKYRFWNADAHPVLHVFIVGLLDFSQVGYRLILFALVSNFAGFSQFIAIVVIYSIVCAGYAQVGWSVVPAFRGHETLMSCITGIETVLYDYTWLEPVPVYSFYIEVHFRLRVVQALVGLWLVAAGWNRHVEFEEDVLSIVVGSGVVLATIYFALYPIYVFIMMKDQVREVFEKRDEFISQMFHRRFECSREIREARIFAT